MNEPLRRALLQAHLREDDVAAHLGVDPKTVRRWLNGRIPYPANRAAIADLLGADEADLWPDAGGPLAARTRPAELVAIYPHRWAVPRDVWIRFFLSAEFEIGILAYSALFLAEDAGIMFTLADRARAGVNVKIALGDPNITHPAKRSKGDPVPANTRHALALYRKLRASENVEIRLHQIILLNSICHADNQVMVSQHIYGTSAKDSPVFSLRVIRPDDMAAAYLDSFERIWASTAQTD